MATQLQLRRGNTAQTVVFTGAVAEVTVDTDQDTVVVHDGVTVGGYYIVAKNQLESNVSLLNSINTTQNTNITAVNNYANSAYGSKCNKSRR
jgi:predicted TIM-barrel enzyme